MRASKLSVSLLLMLALAGCKLGPKYARPAVNTPDSFRGLAPDLNGNAASPNSLGDEKWAEVFKDPALQELIKEALANNYDVRIAAQRVLEQQDQVGITRSQQFPSVSGGGSYTALGLPSSLVKGLSSGSSGSSISTNSYAGESRFPEPGIWTSGDCTGVRPKPRARSCLLPSGDAG